MENSGKHNHTREHVRKMQETDVYKAMLEIKRYCDEHRPSCSDCTISDCGLCDEIFPLAYRFRNVKETEKASK